MKKNICLLMFFVFFSFNIYSLDTPTNPVVQVEEGERAPYSGVLLSEEEYRKLYEAYRTMEEYSRLENNLNFQILKAAEYEKLREEEIALWKLKYELERALRIELENELRKSNFKVRALTVTTSVGLSISLAELLGCTVFAVLYSTMK